jgi:hypothetical protein
MSTGGTLHHKHALFIANLLAGMDIKFAAQGAGFSERHGHRLLKEDAKFQQALDDAKRSLLEPAMMKIRSAVSGAVDCLIEIYSDRAAPFPARVTAAARLIALGLEISDIEDIRTRLIALERRTVNASADWSSSSEISIPPHQN